MILLAYHCEVKGKYVLSLTSVYSINEIDTMTLNYVTGNNHIWY